MGSQSKVVVFAVVILGNMLSATSSLSASFNCDRVTSPTEKAICDDAGLSEHDDFLSTLEKALLRSSGKEEADKFLATQRQWVTDRDAKCGHNVDCLNRAYKSRVEELIGKPASNRGARVVFPHLAMYNEKRFYPYVDALVKDVSINRALRSLMGADYQKYRYSAQTLFIQTPLVGPDGILRVYGGIPQAFTIAEFALVLNPNGKIYVAVLETDKATQRIYYYTNDKSMTHMLPREMQDWKKRFDAVRVVYKYGSIPASAGGVDKF